MDVLTIDFETYYDKDYSLSKVSTEEYIRSPLFEVIGVGVKINDEDTVRWYEEAEFRELCTKTDFSKLGVLCHHTQFDGAILAWRYGVKPKAWFDTLSMARVMVGGYVESYSLDALAKHFGIGTKGTAVLNAKGKRRSAFTTTEWMEYGEYCKTDVNLTYPLFNLMLNGHRSLWEKDLDMFPKSELKLIDSHIRMFTEPVIELDTFLLNKALADTQYLKEHALENAGVTKDELMSNSKFAALLKQHGVVPPTKISPTTGKRIFAFAKTDLGMQQLAEHSDTQVQALVAARLQNKSTLLETRLTTMLGIAERGPMPVYVKYYGADQTGRSSGGDRNNTQNYTRGSALRKAILAPKGYVFVVVDSSNIEARVLNMLAGQDNVLEVFKKNDRGEGPDVYCMMAERLYGRPIDKAADKKERQHGKVTVLGCGYGMGPDKYKETARQQGVHITDEEANASVRAYRGLHPRVQELWLSANATIQNMLAGTKSYLGARDLIQVARDALILPNDLHIKYPNVRRVGGEWIYDSGRTKGIKLYGGKIIENLCQALARIIVMEQALAIEQEYKQVLTVHDEGVFLVLEAKADEALKCAVNAFKTPPTWWPDIPLNAEGGIGYSYGMVK